MKKTSIPLTFAAIFLTILVVDGLLFSLVLDNGHQSMMRELMGNFIGVWIFISVAGLLALIFTFFNYFENIKIRQEAEDDLQRLLNNQKPESPELIKLYDRINEMSAELQKLSTAQGLDKAEIIETERKRMSRELHDSVSQELFAATMILSSVTSEETAVNLSQDQVMTQSRLVLKILHEAQNEMRALLLHLRPIELEGKSLMTGLNALIDELQAKISANLSVKIGDIKTTSNIEDNLFRMAQEILSNTLRHARAENIDISLYQRSGNIWLRISDDGVGFELSDSEKTASYGLANIKERALLLGGEAKVDSRIGQGTIVEIRIPVLETKEEDNG
ncbi:sensor histidine kinase [Lactococcus termiticola]|uniref:histidine kinase n=1 Tax=Lactococcus termiticola TaxID=2169526 RepID=A0A2R5HE11_9LACT|nr:sensor histidine kinase [Lactococcus termiticola]GBG96314.1 two-component system sensor histidine kinase [Lactococcus termiticola]